MAIHLILFILFFGFSLSFEFEPSNSARNGSRGSKKVVSVGVILDNDSWVGEMEKSYISMAISDFYARYPDYKTRLNLAAMKNSGKGPVVAASAALELMKNEGVQVVIGPQRSAEAKFVINLGNKTQIPIISISATSPSLSPNQNPFFIRACQDDYSQIKPLTSIFQAFGWRQVIVIYEDTEFGNGLIPYLTDSLQQIETRVLYRIPISPSSNISKELEKIKAMETRVMLVHMTAFLGSQLFVLAKQAGMMSEGYAWIITTELSTLLDLDPLEKIVIDSMHGVLGVRPYVPYTKPLQDFKTRWNLSRINIFGLWAYDTIWALAKAVESISHENSNASMQSVSSRNSTTTGKVLFGLSVSESGKGLLQKLLSTRFEGLSGEFRLIRGQLKVEKYEIINIMGRKPGESETVIGYWMPEKGISADLVGNGKVANSSSLEELKQRIIWPGNHYPKVPPPKGWVIPVPGNKLRIGVPQTNAGFKEFLKIKCDPKTLKVANISGFSYEVFMAALDKLPFKVPHEFFAYVNNKGKSNGTYDDLLYQIKLQKYDAVVADTTIVANRTTFVDFTLPYIESGVSMLVKVKVDQRNNIWIFLKPLRWDLWLTCAAAFFFTGLVVWILEHHSNADLRLRDPPEQQLSTIFLFSFLTPLFANGKKVKNNWSKFVLIIWVFVILILTQSYTASLATMLTVQRLQSSFADVNELRMNNYYVGYQKNSYVRDLLTGQLNFNESMLRSYASPEEYHQALSKGSKNGGVDAIFDEIPYFKLFLSKYYSGYTMAGPTYKSDGFGFAFPIGSPLVPYISRAILNVTEDYKKMQELEGKYFDDQNKCQDSSSTFSEISPSLSSRSFGGLFIITGVASLFPCLIYLVKFHSNNLPTETISLFWSRIIQMVERLFYGDLPLRTQSSMIYRDDEHEASILRNAGDNLQSHSTSISREVEMVASDEENKTQPVDSQLFINGCA